MSVMISKVLDSFIEKAKLILKVVRLGNNDSLKSFSVLPFGIDSRPIEGTKAVYMETGNDGEPILIGYINVNSIADKGEIRLYSVDSNGNEQNFIYILKNGEIHVGGSADNMVRYSKLEDGFEQLKSDLNDHIQNWNLFAAAYVPGGPTPVGSPPTASTSTPSNADIADTKIVEIKTS